MYLCFRFDLISLLTCIIMRFLKHLLAGHLFHFRNLEGQSSPKLITYTTYPSKLAGCWKSPSCVT